MPTKDFVKDSINQVCSSMYKKNGHWFIVGINERTIIGEIATQLKSIFSPLGFQVHSEYNREGKNRTPKTDSIGKKVLPDIIIHQEGVDGTNLVVIEAKGHWNHTNRKKDTTKLHRLREKHGYLYVYRLELGREKQNLISV